MTTEHASTGRLGQSWSAGTQMVVPADSGNLQNYAGQHVPMTPHRPKAKSPGEWLNAHPSVIEQFRGRWVAVSASGIVGSGSTLQEARTAAEARGFSRDAVIVFKIPGRDGRVLSLNRLALRGKLYAFNRRLGAREHTGLLGDLKIRHSGPPVG